MDDVEVGIRLDKTARRGAHGGTHVGDVEPAARLGADLVGNRRQESAVALEERRTIGVRGVKVERRVLLESARDFSSMSTCTYLGLEERQEATSNQGLAIERGAKMVRVIAAAGDVGDPDESAEGILSQLERFHVARVAERAHIVQTVGRKEVYPRYQHATPRSVSSF